MPLLLQVMDDRLTDGQTMSLIQSTIIIANAGFGYNEVTSNFESVVMDEVVPFSLEICRFNGSRSYID